MKEGTILITGANGQIGTALVEALVDMYGADRVIATDIRLNEASPARFELLNVLDYPSVDQFISNNKVKHIYHLAALLSSRGEIDPDFTWQLNFNAYLQLLRISKKNGVERMFFPSTIGVYGPTTPKVATPQNTSFIPSTVYGISKITAELWNEYYRNKYGMDIRGLRYPGVISHETRPEGGYN